MVPRTLSKWLLVCHLNISQPALMSVLEISHQSTFTFLHTLLPDIKLFDIGHVFSSIASHHLYTSQTIALLFLTAFDECLTSCVKGAIFTISVNKLPLGCLHFFGWLRIFWCQCCAIYMGKQGGQAEDWCGP